MNLLRTLPVVVCFAVTTSAWAASGPLIREEGAVYLEDQLSKPLKVQVVAEAPAYYDLKLSRYLGTLKSGQMVELQAISDHAYRVRGNAQQGQVAGWVEPANLKPLKPDFLANLQKNADRLKQVHDLIAQNQVAINMTPTEVIQSLGKPQKKSSRLDAAGREEVWEYVRYERILKAVTGTDDAGRLVTTYVTVKVPSGKLAVIFNNSLVTSLEQSEGNLNKEARVKIVTAPLDIY